MSVSIEFSYENEGVRLLLLSYHYKLVHGKKKTWDHDLSTDPSSQKICLKKFICLCIYALKRTQWVTDFLQI